VVLVFFAADNTQTPVSVRMAIRAFVAFLRTLPELAWAVMFVMVFGIGAIAGFLALALHTEGSLTTLCYEAMESASGKPVRGLAACGASKLQRCWALSGRAASAWSMPRTCGCGTGMW